MTNLPYTVIKTATQYAAYCARLEELLFGEATDEEEVELLKLLLQTWDATHHPLPAQDPIVLLKGLLADHHLRARDLAALLGIGKSVVSEILGYRRGLSKAVIRKLAAHFSVSQEAFNRPYPLINSNNNQLRDARVMNTPKLLAAA